MICRLVPDEDFDEREAAARGWTRSVLIVLPDGLRYRPLFCTAARLSHDAATALSEDAPCFPVLFTVVVDEIDLRLLEAAADHLIEWGYLARVHPEPELSGQ